MNTDTIDKTSDVWWAENGDEVCRRISDMISRLRYPYVCFDVESRISFLRLRADNPQDFIREASIDARHDLCVLAGMSGGDK